jgi:hypothetical protein
VVVTRCPSSPIDGGDLEAFMSHSPLVLGGPDPVASTIRRACPSGEQVGRGHVRFVVTSVADLQRICGLGATVADAAMLWRLLRDAHLLELEEGHAVIHVRTCDEFDAWVIRAKVAARRERNDLARWAWGDG